MVGLKKEKDVATHVVFCKQNGFWKWGILSISPKPKILIPLPMKRQGLKCVGGAEYSSLPELFNGEFSTLDGHDKDRGPRAFSF